MRRSLPPRRPLLLLMLLSAVVGGAPPAMCPQPSCGMPTVNRLLPPVDFQIPDITFEALSFDGKISNFVCSGACICDTSLSYDGPSTTVHVNVTGLGVVCKGDWSFEQHTIHFPKGSGTVTAEITNSDGGVAVTMARDAASGIPNACSVVEGSCKLSLNFKDIEFQGGLLPKLLNIFRKEIEDTLHSVVQTQACKARPALSDRRCPPAAAALLPPCPAALPCRPALLPPSPAPLTCPAVPPAMPRPGRARPPQPAQPCRPLIQRAMPWANRPRARGPAWLSARTPCRLLC